MLSPKPEMFPFSHTWGMMALLLCLASCATGPNRIPGPSGSVTREEAITIARTYQQLQWTPTLSNLKHGKDPDGILVHTPDADLIKHGHRNGWWKPGEVMTGMPYQWGGFDTPDQFLKDLKRGQAAGDIATSDKRRLDDRGTSAHACGIDCSGFISRCWRLSRQYSTDEFHLICVPLDSVHELRTGDIMLNDKHVLLFHQWDTRYEGSIVVYESTPNPTWRVNIGSIPMERLKREGYRPWRYRNIRD